MTNFVDNFLHVYELLVWCVHKTSLKKFANLLYMYAWWSWEVSKMDKFFQIGMKNDFTKFSYLKLEGIWNMFVFHTIKMHTSVMNSNS
jgi:hypothetical protein